MAHKPEAPINPRVFFFLLLTVAFLPSEKEDIFCQWPAMFKALSEDGREVLASFLGGKKGKKERKKK